MSGEFDVDEYLKHKRETEDIFGIGYSREDHIPIAFPRVPKETPVEGEKVEPQPKDEDDNIEDIIDEYVTIASEINERERRRKELRAKIISLSVEKGDDVLKGTIGSLKINKFQTLDKIDRSKVIPLLVKYNLLESVAKVYRKDLYKLTLTGGEIKQDILAMSNIVDDYIVTLKK